MIEDRIVFDGEEILCIYHKGIDDFVTVNHEERTTLDGKLLEFIEQKVDSDIVLNKVSSLASIQGVLSTGEDLNPYGHRASAHCSHYIVANKLSFLLYSDEFTSNDANVLVELFDFINTYCGLQFKKYPLHLGDIFIFEPIPVEGRGNEVDGVDGLTLTNLPVDSMLIVHFKSYDDLGDTEYIVDTAIINVESGNRSINISSEHPWQSFDIFIYREGKLIYKSIDNSIMRLIHMTIDIQCEPVELSFKRLGKTTIQQPSEKGTFTVGKMIEPKLLRKYNKQIVDNMALYVDDVNKILYGGSDEDIQIEKDYIIRQLEHAADEIVICDSYFTDYRDDKDKDKIFEWLAILANMSAKSKTIVFYITRKDGINRAFTADELLRHIPLHRAVANYYRNHNNSLGIRCIETKIPIHDRFIFTRTDKDVQCLVVGTSFNSLGENFHCIHKYTGTTAKSLYENIMNNAVQPHMDGEAKLL
ncbi:MULTISPECIES: hypothetical protein [Veillonella]|uniref:hypothetical protein n=1 Tax=Veillonella TaxID=29465 RepID=UPI00076722B3|nr:MULTISPECIES: hypothetical protein [Veillonella]KXB82258.1 hypothetical protein HMPREF1865_01916 [Veillonella parvula]RJV50447.1 hypothetical protein DWV85_05860 [Veillonella sp. AF13-2]